MTGRRLLQGWLAGIVLWISLASPLWAHIALVSAEPEPGAQLANTPPQIRLNFSETLAPTSTVALYRDNFQAVAPLTVRRDPEQPQQLIALVPAAPPGLYTVQWTATGADGDRVTGSFAFQVTGVRGLGDNLWWLISSGASVLLLGGYLWRRKTRRVVQ